MGGQRPSHLSHIDALYVPQFTNDTLSPRASTLATNLLVDAITEDGSYKISNSANADATLRGTVREIKYSTLRSNRLDSLRSEELSMHVLFSWQLIDSKRPTNVLDSGTVSGYTSLFDDANQDISRTNAMEHAFRDAARKLTSQLADGF